jgi:outer membrane protein
MRTTIVTAFIAFLAIVSTALAQAPVATATTPFKIGIINTEACLEKYSVYKAAEEKVKRDVSAVQAEITKRENEVKALNDKLEKQSMYLTAETKKDLADSLKQKYMLLQQFVQQKQEDAVTKRADLLKPILDTVNKIIQKVGKENNYDIVLDMRGAVLYAAPKNDLTDQVAAIFAARSSPSDGKKDVKEVKKPK